MDTRESELESMDASSEVVSEEAGTSESRHDHAGMETMSAATVLERLRLGQPIERVKINDLQLKGEFAQPVRFHQVSLSNLTVKNATFAEPVTFERCTLDRPKFNRRSHYEKGLSFANSTLVRPELRRLTVNGVLRLDNTKLKSRLLLEACVINGKIKFWDANCSGWMELKDCEFFDEFDGRSVCIEEGLVISRCKFHGNALFRGTTVHKKLQADGSWFNGLLDLSKAKLHDFVYLEGIEQGENQRFAFTNALAERILVRPEQLKGRLKSECEGNHAQAMQEYGLIKRAYEGLHRYEDEDWAFYRFKVNQRLCKQRSWSNPCSKLSGFADWLLLDHGCGYGTNPGRAVRAALLIILVFTLIYALGIESFHIESGGAPFDGPKTTVANRLMVGALTSVSAFTSGFGDLREAAKGWMNVALIAESLLGTLLWGLFIVAFSRKVIR